LGGDKYNLWLRFAQQKTWNIGISKIHTKLEWGASAAGIISFWEVVLRSWHSNKMPHPV
jgi:hypothetical protein